MQAEEREGLKMIYVLQLNRMWEGLCSGRPRDSGPSSRYATVQAVMTPGSPQFYFLHKHGSASLST